MSLKNPHGLSYVDLATFRDMVHDKAPVDNHAVLAYHVNETLKTDGPQRRIPFCISNNSVDRDRDTIAVDGWQLGHYQKNPVVLWAHDYWQPPIARGLDTQMNAEQGLLSVAEFFTPDVYAFADTIYRLIQAGGLKASSVGFRPLDYKVNEERRGIDILQAELLEWSVVPVPANPEALVRLGPKSAIKAIQTWAEQYLDETYGGKGVWVPREQVEAVFKAMNATPMLAVGGSVSGEQQKFQVPLPNGGSLVLDLTLKESDLTGTQQAASSASSSGSMCGVEDEPESVLPDAPAAPAQAAWEPMSIVLELDEESCVPIERTVAEKLIEEAVKEQLAALVGSAVSDALDYARGRVR